MKLSVCVGRLKRRKTKKGKLYTENVGALFLMKMIRSGEQSAHYSQVTL
jgi:hypothetical protein